MKVTRAVIPAAGYGTRFLPATKAIPKEMLPIVDIPSIHYIVEECIESGITDICILLGRNKNCIADYFDRNIEIESALTKAGQYDTVRKMNELSQKANISYIRQYEMNGTGGAVALCESFTSNQPFAVLFGDDVMYSPNNPVTKQLIDAFQTTSSVIVGVQELSSELATKCGVVVPGRVKGNYTEISGFAEKPPIDKLPSRLASLGRYILTPSIFEYIKKTTPAKNGEVYLPSAIEALAKEQGAFAYTFEGKRYDIGDKLGYLKANVEFALRNQALAPSFKAYLKGLIAEMG